MPEHGQAAVEFAGREGGVMLEAKVQQAVDEFLSRQARRIGILLGRCESPIEHLFAMGLLNSADCSLTEDAHAAFAHAASIGLPPSTYPMMFNESGAWIYQQLPLEIGGRKMRLDFAIYFGSVKVAVELDGHDFHERTKEQAERDKSRDRLLQANGWTVLRYTGSEVWRDADSCANEAIQTALDLEYGQ